MLYVLKNASARHGVLDYDNHILCSEWAGRRGHKDFSRDVDGKCESECQEISQCSSCIHKLGSVGKRHGDSWRYN